MKKKDLKFLIETSSKVGHEMDQSRCLVKPHNFCLFELSKYHLVLYESSG
jgi:hypothetical protein